MLEYPPCCIEKTKKQNIDAMIFLEKAGMLGRGQEGKLPREAIKFDAYITEQMKDIFGDGKVNFSQAIDLLREKDSGLRSAYFATNFYPCSTGCAEASKVGRGIIDGFGGEDGDLARFYDLTYFPSNIVYLHSLYSDDSGLGCKHMVQMNTTMMYFDGLAKMLGYGLPVLPDMDKPFSMPGGVRVTIRAINMATGEVVDLSDPAEQSLERSEAELPPLHVFMERLSKFGPDAKLI